MYAAPLERVRPPVRAGSRAAHLDAGASEVAGDLASLRQDVDDLDDLDECPRLGLGPRTPARRPEMQ